MQKPDSQIMISGAFKHKTQGKLRVKSDTTYSRACLLCELQDRVVIVRGPRTFSWRGRIALQNLRRGSGSMSRRSGTNWRCSRTCAVQSMPVTCQQPTKQQLPHDAMAAAGTRQGPSDSATVPRHCCLPVRMSGPIGRSSEVCGGIHINPSPVLEMTHNGALGCYASLGQEYMQEHR